MDEGMFVLSIFELRILAPITMGDEEAKNLMLDGKILELEKSIRELINNKLKEIHPDLILEDF